MELNENELDIDEEKLLAIDLAASDKFFGDEAALLFPN
jgi:hypothetical protein